MQEAGGIRRSAERPQDVAMGCNAMHCTRISPAGVAMGTYDGARDDLEREATAGIGGAHRRIGSAAHCVCNSCPGGLLKRSAARVSDEGLPPCARSGPERALLRTIVASGMDPWIKPGPR